MVYDELEKFCEWALNNIPTIGAIPLHGAVHKIEDVISVTWYRSGQFQIQMFIVPPNYVIPEHTHPNVDSIEVYLGGQIRFSHLGKFVVPEEMYDTPGDYGLSQARGGLVRVKPDEIHGGIFGPSGGVFMSVQHWLNGVEPHCVAADYTGPTMGADHFKKVIFGEPVLKNQDELSAFDAASAELLKEEGNGS